MSTWDWNMEHLLCVRHCQGSGDTNILLECHSSVVFTVCMSTVFLEIREFGENCFQKIFASAYTVYHTRSWTSLKTNHDLQFK